MNSNIIYITRALIIFAIQVLLLKRLDYSYGAFLHIQFFLYPLFVVLLPNNWNRALLMLIAFGFGLAIDAFYDSAGLHAGTLVLIAFIKPYVLKRLEPRGGYKNYSLSPKNMSWQWYLRYLTWILVPALVWFFVFESLGFPAILPLLIKLLLSYVVSVLVMSIYMVVFNPKV